MGGMAPFLPDAGRPGRWPLSIVGSVLLHMGAAGGILMLAQTAPPPVEPDAAEPRFAITLETLTPSTLAGVMTVDPPPDVTPSLDPPEALPPVEGPEIADPVDPALPEAPIPDDPPIDPQVAVPVAPVTPELTAPVVAAPATAPVAPSITSPVTPVAPVIAATGPEVVAPVGPVAPISPLAGPGLSGGGGGGVPTAAIRSDVIVTGPVAPAPDVIASISGPSLVRPSTPPSGGGGTGSGTTAPAPPSVQDIAVSALIGRVAATPGQSCALALPRRAGSDGASLALIGSDGGALDALARDVLSGDLAETPQTRDFIDGRQCPVLDWVAQTQDYPATRLGLRLDARVVDSGTALTGIVQGVGGRFLTLLLIDDNGVVQDLAPFTTISGNLARFDAPVTRDGVSRDTRQVVLALATRTAPSALRGRMGQLAQDVFTGLPDDLSRAILAVETVDVR
ncbi:hypothetical protein [Jannaschia pohangensis]|uniref:Uncharacterized protein n=1 Tax=Jannaschia pohangensis TaxID=390807 RepID=A0A1I3UHS2_9RHOB|nr:hypothetical protein [Jannaschia pohangensis]SFJ83058.1 hypothetical protein SAMN04488095_3776 [Jannaschia pohangensis]